MTSSNGKNWSEEVFEFSCSPTGKFALIISRSKEGIHFISKETTKVREKWWQLEKLGEPKMKPNHAIGGEFVWSPLGNCIVSVAGQKIVLLDFSPKAQKLPQMNYSTRIKDKVSIIESAMLCSDVSGNNGDPSPVGATEEFKTNSKWVIVWTNFQNIVKTHNIIWKWYTSDGDIYFQKGPYELNPKNTQNGKLALWAKMGIDGEPASLLPGKWKVVVSLDGDDILERSFKIED